MITRDIVRGSPDRVFIVVSNNSATTMTIGRGVVFDYVNTAQQNGYSVTWKGDQTSNIGMLAGVVVGKNIEPSGAYGLVQCFGHVDSLYYSGAGSTALTGFDATTQAGYFLSLAAGTTGYFSGYAVPTGTTFAGLAATVVADILHMVNAAVYLGSTCYNGSTANTYTNATNGNLKAFIRAM
jgi:hypothetical protein